ncbi:EthD domain-containing protein [Amycolatopsis pithecellobii]|nr:EthD domain-containing protein [Amycolatopsis pithecellobii]
MIVFNKKKDGLSLEQYRDYYENVHAPLIRSFFPTVGVYRRNYVDRERTALTERNADAAQAQTDFDSITEAFFEDWEAFEAFRNKNAEPAVRARIVADEVNFLEPSAIRRYIVIPDGDSPWH